MVIHKQTNDKNISGFLQKGFNKKKSFNVFSPALDSDLAEMQKIAKNQCLGKKKWPEINEINAWLLSAETATFMK